MSTLTLYWYISHCPIGMVFYTSEWSRAGLTWLGFELFYSGFFVLVLSYIPLGKGRNT